MRLKQFFFFFFVFVDFSPDILKDVLALCLRSYASRQLARLGRPAHCGDLSTIIADVGKALNQFEICEMESELGTYSME